MKSYGNGTAETCVKNLCKIICGEVYGDRIRGINGALIDKNVAVDDIKEDVKWLVNEYEPRVEAERIEVKSVGEGDYVIEISTDKRGEDNGRT